MSAKDASPHSSAEIEKENKAEHGWEARGLHSGYRILENSQIILRKQKTT